MVEVKREPKENFGSMLRRFTERVKKSRDLEEVRESRWRVKRKTRRERREAALVKVRRHIEYKRKVRMVN